MRASVLRAARKLEDHGLLELGSRRRYERAHDPRRIGPIYRDGQFWDRTEQTRRHVVRRRIVWLSPFGFELVLRYRSQLDARAPIRWDEQVVREAEAAARRLAVARDARRDAEHEWERRDREASIEAALDQAKPSNAVVPPFVRSSDDRERWQLSTWAAKAAHPSAGSSTMWSAACAFFQSSDDREALRAQGHTGRPRETATDRLLARRVARLR